MSTNPCLTCQLRHNCTADAGTQACAMIVLDPQEAREQDALRPNEPKVTITLPEQMGDDVVIIPTSSLHDIIADMGRQLCAGQTILQWQFIGSNGGLQRRFIPVNEVHTYRIIIDDVEYLQSCSCRVTVDWLRRLPATPVTADRDIFRHYHVGDDTRLVEDTVALMPGEPNVFITAPRVINGG